MVISVKGTLSDFLDYQKNKAIRVLCLLILFGWPGFLAAQVQFENTTEALGGPFHTGESWGASWGSMNDDVYPDLYVSNHGMLNSILRNNNANSFTDTVQTADLDGATTISPEQDIHGGAWADFDNDGDQDLFVTRSSQGARLYVFQNNGNGQFRERGGSFGIGGIGGGRMPLLFDYTNDGRLDVSVAGNGGNRIFRRQGNRFQEVTSAAEIGGECRGGHGGAVSEFFDDGRLYYLCTSPHGIPETAHDMSTIPFTDGMNKFDRIGTTPDSVLADFNNDLKMDIFAVRGLTRPSGVSRVSSNRIEAWLGVGGRVHFQKSFTFKANGPIEIDIAGRNVGRNGNADNVFIGSTGYNPNRIPFTLDPNNQINRGVLSNRRRVGAFIEYNQASEEWTIHMSSGGGSNGEAAFFSVNGNGLTQPTIEGLTNSDMPQRPRFLFNNGSRLENASSRGIGNLYCGGIAAADYDNDMDIDLYLVCRTSTENIENRLYLNNGSGSFSLASGSTGAEGLLGVGIFSGAGTGEMAVTADYDVDGFMDLFVTNGNRLRPRLDQDGIIIGGPDQFYRNLGNGNHWLEFDLEGVNSNRDGFGTKVIVTAGGTSQLREQNGQYHRWSHDHKRLHFGLAQNTRANVRIEWPDGTVDTYNNVTADRLYRATQNDDLTNITPTGNGNPPPPPIPSISLTSASVLPGEDAQLTVRLSSPSNTTVTVDYNTADGTAVSGQDYIESSGTITFQPNQTSRSIVISTLDDVTPEPAESLNLILSNASGATISQTSGTVTIRATDSIVCGEPDFSPGTDRAFFIWQDCGQSEDWLVRATAGGGDRITYNAVFRSNTAFGFVSPFSFEGSDNFELMSSNTELDVMMTMLNSGQDGIQYSLAADSELCLTLADPNQIIFVGAGREAFASPLNLRTLGAVCENGVPSLSVADVSVSEGMGSAEVVVELNTASTELVSVSYSTSNGSASSPQDYSSVSGVLNFPINQTTRTVSIPIVADGIDEMVETFNFTLNNPVNAGLSRAVSQISISDSQNLACGMPSFSSSIDAAIFLWQDCGNSDRWFMRATAGGGSPITYTGSVVTDTSITSLDEFSFEGVDSANLSNSSRRLDFLVRMNNSGVDGLDFSIQAGGNVACFDTDTSVTVGQNNTLVVPPFNIFNLDPC